MPRGRILCLTSNFPRWPEDSTTPFVLRLNQDLQQLGWEITVLAPHAPGAKTEEILEGVAVHRFRYLWPESQETVCYQGGALINLRKHRGNYAKLPALIACEWWQTMKRLRQERFDLLHSHWLLPQGFIGALSAGLLGIPHVCTVHGGDVFGLQSPLLKKFKAVTIRRCDAVTVNSSATRQAVNTLCPDYSSLHTIPMGVAVSPLMSSADQLRHEEFRARFRCGEGPLIIFIGRLVDEKGLADLLEAIAILKEKMPDTTLLAVGEGQDRPELERRTTNLGLQGSVHFTGWVNEQDLPVYLASADIFVAPSRTARDGWIEAQGLTIIEAMMEGVPVIATRTGGIVDSINHEVSGLLVNERSPSELAAAIERLQTDPGMARRLAEKGREEAISKFSRQASAEKFSELFSLLIDAKKTARRKER